MLAAPVNAAGVISVNTVNDEDNTGDSCSLREAIKAANTDAAYGGCTAGSGTDTITLPVGTYTLSLGDQLPPVTSAIVVEGNESIIQAHVDPDTASWRVFEVVNGGDLTLEDLTVRHGYCVNALSCASQDNPDDDKGNGGGIFNGGILTLDNVDITMNYGGERRGRHLPQARRADRAGRQQSEQFPGELRRYRRWRHRQRGLGCDLRDAGHVHEQHGRQRRRRNRQQ